MARRVCDRMSIFKLNLGLLVVYAVFTLLSVRRIMRDDAKANRLRQR